LNVQYKYLRKYNGEVTWESDPNDEYSTPPEGPSAVEDT
jgi:glucoamylase